MPVPIAIRRHVLPPCAAAVSWDDQLTKGKEDFSYRKTRQESSFPVCFVFLHSTFLIILLSILFVHMFSPFFTVFIHAINLNPQCLLLFICEISRLFSSPIPSPCTPHSPPASFALRPELHDLPAKLPPTLHDKPEWSPMNLCLSALSAHLSSGYLVSCRL